MPRRRHVIRKMAEVKPETPEGVENGDCDAYVSQDDQTTEGIITEEEDRQGLDLAAIERQLRSVLDNGKHLGEVQKSPIMKSLRAKMAKIANNGSKQDAEEKMTSVGTDENVSMGSVSGHKSTSPVSVIVLETSPVASATVGTSKLASPVVENKWNSPNVAKLRQTGTELHYVELEVKIGVTIANITKEDV